MGAGGNSDTQRLAEYERMARELELMAENVRNRHDINNHFAERLELLAKQMRDDIARLKS